MMALVVRADKKKKKGPEYQYNEAQYHPVEEYLVSDVEKWTSDTPSFVLEVTWPRVALFYHPASSLCLDLRDRYVSVAREIRRRSIRAPVEFWAVSCQVHRDACEDLGIHAVPRLLAFPAGKIDGRLIPRTENNDIRVDTIINLLNVNLKEVDEEQVQQEQELERGQAQMLELERKINENNNNNNNMPQESDHLHEILHPHSSLANVYADAMTSILHSMDNSVDQDESSGEAIPWSYDRVRVFREWLDLMHWALPTRDMALVHNIINDMRNNIGAIEDNPGEITRVLTRHDYFRTKPKWSEACQSTNRQDRGYTCGFWKLLHIVSIGVDQQHERVLGDLNRVMVSHVVTVLRDFVREFGFAGSTEGQRLFVRAYEDCLDDAACRKELGFPKRGILSPFRRSIPPRTDRVWKNMALWLWQRHQAYRNHKLTQTKKGYEILNKNVELQWPPSSLCPTCYSSRQYVDGGGESTTEEVVVDESLVVDRLNHILWNRDPVFAHLKHEYWPRALQSPRVVVLDRWDRGRIASYLRDKRREAVSSPLLTLVVVVATVALLVYALTLYQQRQHRIRRIQRRLEKRFHNDQWVETWKQHNMDRGTSIHQRRRRNPLNGVRNFRPFLDD